MHKLWLCWLIFSINSWSFFELFKQEKEEKPIKFNGISIKNIEGMICKEEKTRLLCSHPFFTIKVSLEKLDKHAHLGLRLLNKKKTFEKKYKIFNYQEFKLDSEQKIIQQFLTYDFNNINLPFIYRAFDMNLGNGRVISIKEKINFRAWPKFKDRIEEFELSFK